MEEKLRLSECEIAPHTCHLKRKQGPNSHRFGSLFMSNAQDPAYTFAKRKKNPFLGSLPSGK